MNCELLQEDICAYADNELEPAERVQVEAHIDACEACADEVRAMRSVRALVGRLRLLDEDPPASLAVLPDGLEVAPATTAVSWWRRPVRGRAIALAAAAVLVALAASWRSYERRFIHQTQMREAVVAHLSAVAELGYEPSDDAMPVSIQPTQVGHRVAQQNVYTNWSQPVSELRFPADEFDDSYLTPVTVGGRDYRTGQIDGFSIASWHEGPFHIVAVSACAPEALVSMAQNIPVERPVPIDGMGY